MASLYFGPKGKTSLSISIQTNGETRAMCSYSFYGNSKYGGGAKGNSSARVSKHNKIN